MHHMKLCNLPTPGASNRALQQCKYGGENASLLCYTCCMAAFVCCVSRVAALSRINQPGITLKYIYHTEPVWPGLKQFRIRSSDKIFEYGNKPSTYFTEGC